MTLKGRHDPNTFGHLEIVLVLMEHIQENTYSESNCHVTDDAS